MRFPSGATSPELRAFGWDSLPNCLRSLKIDMEPKNHPIEKETHLPNLHFGVPWSFSGPELLFFPDHVMSFMGYHGIRVKFSSP